MEDIKTKMGRPRKEIDWVQFDKLCYIQCPLTEIAAWFECSVDNIENKVKEAHGVSFSVYSAQKRGPGKTALRRRQYEAAMAGDRTMMIWLGKQWLDQKEKQDITTGNEKFDFRHIDVIEVIKSLKQKKDSEK